MSIKVNIYNQKAEAVGELKLSEKVFGVKVNEHLVHQAVVTQMANERQVLAHTKIRSEVRGGGKKPWRQKGTGRARAGSSRSPIWIGGGITFGPLKTRNFSKKINKKMKQKALLMALSDKAAGGNLMVVDELKIEEFKTKKFDAILKNLLDSKKQITDRSKEGDVQGGAKTPASPADRQKRKNTKDHKKSVLIINDKKDEKVKFSGRNLAGVEIINSDNINIIGLLKYRDLVMTLGAVKKLEERYK